VPAALCSRVTSHFHDNPESGHFGAQNTAERGSRHIYWPAMDSELLKYVAGCELCNRIKLLHHTSYRITMPQPPPSRHSEGLTMDFVTNFPVSMASGYPGILGIVDLFAKMTTYLLCRKDIDSPELAQMFFEHLIWKRGVIVNITTDRGKEFTSRFRDRVCADLSNNHQLSSAFHPQTDGQTERQDQAMEQHL